jgi:hypothetical protein
MPTDNTLLTDLDVVLNIFSKSRINADGCWVWQAAMANGYPMLSVAPGGVRAVRPIIFQQWMRKLAANEVLYPKCLNAQCVNPDHFGTRRRGTK